MLRGFVVLSALLTSVATSGEELPKWIESPTVFLPEDVEEGQRPLTEGEVFVDVPLRWAFAGKLASDVAVVTAGETVTLKQGEVFPQVLIPVAGNADGGRTLLCTRSKVIEKREETGLFANIVRDLRDSLRDAQRCVEDTDHDGTMDRAVVLGEGEDIVVAEPINPVAYELLENAIIPGGQDKLTISLSSVGKTRSTVTVNVIQMGNPREFDTMTSGRFFTAHWPTFQYKNGLPATVNSLGVTIALLEADRWESTATLRWASYVADGEYVIIPRTTQLSIGY